MTAPNRKTFRNILFWLHLSAGFLAGLVLLSMACSGMLMAFAPQVIDRAEHTVSLAASAPETTRLPADSLFTLASIAVPDARIESMVFAADPSKAVLIGFAKDRGGAFLDPHTGTVLGKTSRLRAYFLTVEHWHRWMGEAKRGAFLTHAAALALIFMVLSGWFLWIPRRSGTEARTVTSMIPDWKLQGRAGERNMHMTFGFWAGSVLLIIGLTGSVMGYRWAEGLLYSLSGSGISSKPTLGKSGGEPSGRERATATADLGFNAIALDSLLDAAWERCPRGSAVNIRLPQKSGGPLIAMIDEPGWLEFPRRSRLSVNPVSGALLKWEPFADQSLGRKCRSWVMPLHTGRGFGIAGQGLIALAAFSLALLVWTGLSLGIRRVAGRFRKRREIPPGTILEPMSRRTAQGLHRNGSRPWKRK